MVHSTDPGTLSEMSCGSGGMDSAMSGNGVMSWQPLEHLSGLPSGSGMDQQSMSGGANSSYLPFPLGNPHVMQQQGTPPLHGLYTGTNHADSSPPGWGKHAFAGMGNGNALSPEFCANDIRRSTSQPAKKRDSQSPAHWSTGGNNRDTLYAHEFLKAFRARMPDSAEGQAACDYCRKRKIKVCVCCGAALTRSAIGRSRRAVTARNRGASARATTCCGSVGHRARKSGSL